MLEKTNYDELLVEKLIEESKNGYAILTAYISDEVLGKRRNQKRSKKLEEKIIENGFSHKTIEIIHNKLEIEQDFIVFGIAKNSEKTVKDFVNECLLEKKWRISIISTNLEDYLKDRKFYHPFIKSEKESYLEKNEIIVLQTPEFPENKNGWHLRKVSSETCLIYELRNLLCIVSLQEDGQWRNCYGSIRPIGVTLKTEFFNSLNEALNNLKDPLKR